MTATVMRRARSRRVWRGPARLRLALAAALIAVLGPAAARAELRLIPEPASVTLGAGRFPLKGAVAIAVPSGDEEDLFAASLLADEIRSATGSQPTIATRRDGGIVLARDPGLAAAGEEGYRIEASAAGVRVSARTAAGLFYGVQTLRQMVEADGIPAATIDDQPALRWRGVHDDVSRGPVPTVAALERRIALLAEFKVNLYALYSENAIVYRSHPLVGIPGGSFTPDELRELAAHARRHHVALLIEQQTFSHLERTLGLESYKDLAEIPGSGVLAPANSKVQAFAESLLAEAAPLSTAPFVHVGGDEGSEIGQGQSRALIAARGAGPVYVERLTRLRDALARQGKRLMFWGDFVESHPELAAKLPKDCVATVWDYENRQGFEAKLAPFRDAGLDVFVCPGASNWNRLFPNLDTALPNIRAFTRDGQKRGALGELTCTWDDNGDALFGLCWYPVLYGAAAAWKRGDCDPDRFRAAFDWAFLRSPGHEAADAIEKVGSAHGILKQMRPLDATLELFWLNPARGSLDRQLLGLLDPGAADLRLAEEQALAGLERARAKARRNADQLDYAAFAARRIHAVGQRAQFAERFKALYVAAVAGQATKDKAVEKLTTILGLIAQGREQTALLRDEYQRLWLLENRPYWLGNVIAQFDRDLEVWSEKWDRIRVAIVSYRNGTPLPTPEQMGFLP